VSVHKILHAASLSRPARAGVLLLAVAMLGLVTLIDSGTPWEVSFGHFSDNVLLTRIRSELDLLLSLENRRVTASIGAVTFVKPEGSVDAMVKMADQLMYVAKKNGTNRVEHRIVRGAHDDTRSANA
jgi:hypothetical protein